MGIRVLPPDVNSSEFTFTPVDGRAAIRFGLGAIKNVGANAVESIVKARDEGGKFTSLYDFCERVDLGAVNRRMIESFIKAGAMDSLEGTARAAVRGDRWRDGNRRARVEGSRQRPIRTVRRPAAKRACGRASSAQRPRLDPAGEAHRRKGDARVLHHRPSARSVHGQSRGARDAHHVGTWKGSRRTPKSRCAASSPASSASATRKASCGRRMQIEDLEGAVEAMVFSTQYERLLPVAQRRSRPCWCAGWCCPKKTPRRKFPCRTSCRSKSRA